MWNTDDKLSDHNVFMCFKVKAQNKDSKYIQVASKCDLIKDQSYTVECRQACKIQPNVSISDKWAVSTSACWYDP